MSARVCIIGLDCLTPQLVFERFIDCLPNFQALMHNGAWGPLKSTMPPITVPAWASMVTGLSPGTLGLYGFRGRADRSYDARRLASSLSYTQPPLWTLLSRAGLRCRVMNVPQTFPPKPLRGTMLTGFLTPADAPAFTYPASLSEELRKRPDKWKFDVSNFRNRPRQEILEELYAMTTQHFDLLEGWLRTDDWDFLMFVEIGPDRLHHVFWRYAHPEHHGYVPGHKFEHALRDYYVELDRHLGRVMGALGPEDILLVVSDHGAQTMDGAIAINQWLVQSGHMVLHDKDARVPNADNINWEKTRAWADGGYVARVYLNVLGREPNGIVAAEKVDDYIAELTDGLTQIRGMDEQTLDTRVYRPDKVYPETRGVPPDLMVCFDNLRYRAVASIGHQSVAVRENDTGADDANHAQQGIVLLRDGRASSKLRNADILDIAPTVLQRLGVPIPKGMSGTPL